MRAARGPPGARNGTLHRGEYGRLLFAGHRTIAAVVSGHTQGIPWRPVSRVEKYSADQTAWARRRLGAELSWGRRVIVRALGIAVPVLHGDWLRELFAEPECGIACDEGNLVTEVGLVNLALLLTGGGYPLTPGRTVFGVGTDGETAASPRHVHLANAVGEGHGRSWYRPMDPGFPSPEGAGLTGQATFTESEANWGWHEWCWASGEPELQPGPVLRQCFGGEHAMLNRRAPAAGFGLKEAGVAWVFRTEITFLDRNAAG